MLVGQPPGDKKTIAGKSFVGPAGLVHAYAVRWRLLASPGRRLCHASLGEGGADLLHAG